MSEQLVITRNQLVAGAMVAAYALTSGFAALQAFGWYLIPISIIAVIAAVRVSSINDSHYGFFDLRLVVWVIIYYTQALTPALNVALDYYVSSWPYPIFHARYQEYIGWFGSIALAATLLFVVLERLFLPRQVNLNHRPLSIPDSRNALPVLVVAMVLASLTQVFILANYGGISGYLYALTEDRSAFEGMGWAYALAEPFPIIFLMAATVVLVNRRSKPKLTTILIILAAFLLLKLIFGGLRGSRSNTIWGVFWALCVVNVFFYKVRLRIIVLFIGLVLSFMTIYSLYKTYGIGLLDENRGAVLTDTGRYDGRPVVGVLLEDFSRSGFQSAVLQRHYDNQAYRLRRGETYLGALALLIPKSFYPGTKPDTKVEAGTELIYGEYYAATRNHYSSRIYGLFGEAVLNFPAVFAFLMVIPFFAAYRVVYTYFHSLQRTDIRQFLYPLFVNGVFVLFVSDSDNVVFFIVKNGAIPIALIAWLVWFSRGRSVRREVGKQRA